ncbi:hypothetical protein AVEN_69510-1, partial [Araneus ventricosus]
MTRRTSELAPFSKLPHHTCGRTFGPYIWFDLQQAYIHGGSSVESGLQPATLRPLSRRREQTSTNPDAQNVYYQINVT